MNKINRDKIDKKYPPNIFCDSETGYIHRGVQEETYIRRMTKEEESMFNNLSKLLGGK